MSRYNHKHSLSVKAYLYRILFSLIATAILVVFMLPIGSEPTYRYERGEPWDDEALISQDSFPILKSADSIARELEVLRQSYEPYYSQNTSIMEQQLKMLHLDLNSPSAANIPRYFQPYLQEKLRHIYSTGILTREDAAKLEKEKPRQVNIFHGNESNKRSLSQLFSEKTAYEYLIREEDKVHYNHSYLRGFDLMKYVSPNLTYDKEKSEQQKREIDGRLVRTTGSVRQGQKIVDRGQIVDDEVYSILQSMEQYQQENKLSTQEKVSQIIGRTVYAAILVVLLLLYFQQFRSDYLDDIRTMLLVMTLSLFFPIVTYLIVSYTAMAHTRVDVFMVPYCVLPIMLRIFLDSRTAFVTHVIAVLASAIVITQPFTFIVTQIVAGLVAIYSLRELSQRYELFRTAVLVTLATLLTYLCLEFARGTAIESEEISRMPYLYLTVAGILSMLVYLLLIPVERIFGFTSIVTLVELQNINNPLLRRLSEEANGTFNHSMQVANLAAEVANKIGGKAQLVRTGALYHDIGKLENAVFFTENQNGQNPHDGLPYERSAQIIIQHVEKGLRLADKYKLPTVVRDFIATHHGRSFTRYFYVSKKNENPGAPIDERLFTYPGPKPQTLEQAILMMADAVEAASRSLPEYTEESINAMVEKIVGAQVNEGSFSECAITFREIEEAKEVLGARLRTVYHTRIQYPE
ncbi:MAG: HDIG domain-containing protein [Bacteroidaceae bacterium]|nr:HDIG domain-containing protein [Bacteroidaceae bacterium]